MKTTYCRLLFVLIVMMLGQLFWIMQSVYYPIQNPNDVSAAVAAANDNIDDKDSYGFNDMPLVFLRQNLVSRNIKRGLMGIHNAHDGKFIYILASSSALRLSMHELAQLNNQVTIVTSGKGLSLLAEVGFSPTYALLLDKETVDPSLIKSTTVLASDSSIYTNVIHVKYVPAELSKLEGTAALPFAVNITETGLYDVKAGGVYMAIQLAYHLGASTLFVTGFDRGASVKKLTSSIELDIALQHALTIFRRSHRGIVDCSPDDDYVVDVLPRIAFSETIKNSQLRTADMTVGICITCANSLQHLRDALQALTTQEDVIPGMDYTVLVMLNSCYDEVASRNIEYSVLDIFEEVGCQHCLVATSPFVGLSYCKNSIVSATNGVYIGFVDDDGVVGPRWVRSVLDGFEKDSEISIIGGPITGPDGYSSGANSALNWGDKTRYLQPPTAMEYLSNGGPFERLLGGNCVYNRVALLRSGWFDVSFGRRRELRLGYEDIDLLWRITAVGGRLLYDPNVSFLHRTDVERNTKAYEDRAKQFHQLDIIFARCKHLGGFSTEMAKIRNILQNNSYEDYPLDVEETSTKLTSIAQEMMAACRKHQPW